MKIITDFLNKIFAPRITYIYNNKKVDKLSKEMRDSFDKDLEDFKKDIEEFRKMMK